MVARHVNVMVVSAVVPVQRQFDEFERPWPVVDSRRSRDLPWYINFEVQRADVTANPAGPINWDDPAAVVTIDPRAVFKSSSRPEPPRHYSDCRAPFRGRRSELSRPGGQRRPANASPPARAAAFWRS
jgi:hypothetical protein